MYAEHFQNNVNSLNLHWSVFWKSIYSIKEVLKAINIENKDETTLRRKEAEMTLLWKSLFKKNLGLIFKENYQTLRYFSIDVSAHIQKFIEPWIKYN